MKVAILGGAFDPPHIGHYLVAQQVKEKLHMDKVWLMPCYTYFPEFPIKYSHINQAHLRLAMTTLCRTKNISVSNFEYVWNKGSKTIQTLEKLTKTYPSHSFFWIIGSDNLDSFHRWDQWKKIIAKYNIIVFPRDTDFKTLEKRVQKAFHLRHIPANIIIVEGDLMVSSISSSQIRKRIRAGLSVKQLVIPQVEKFIKDNKLYVSNKR